VYNLFILLKDLKEAKAIIKGFFTLIGYLKLNFLVLIGRSKGDYIFINYII